MKILLARSLVLLRFAQAAVAGPGPTEQLARMANALRSLSYEGTVVYLHDNRLESLRVYTPGRGWAGAGASGFPQRASAYPDQGKGKVTCELSASRPISVPGSRVGREMLHPVTLDPRVLRNYYGIYPLGDVRVAGRYTQVVGVIPRDRLRYGYRFYLGRESGLPL